MNEGSDTHPLSADWSVVGKYPGRTMGYEVLRGSLPSDRAERYYWGAATGTPDDRETAGGLPWRVFLSGVPGEERPTCARVETTWDGSVDGTGAPSYTWRLLVVDWMPASTVRLTWTALDRAAPHTRPEPAEAAVSIEAGRTTADELARTVDRLGFDWAARIAALLLEGRQVAIVPAPGAGLPDTDDRVVVLDAVCSLLPYGCRAWLSAATWTGQSEHRLMLVFAAAARTGQAEARLDAGSRPPEPQTAVGREYLNELLRLRARRESTAELVAHLLGAGDAISSQDPKAALRALREADLLDSVLTEIGQGGGELADVTRVLDTYAPNGLTERQLGLLLPFLARRAPAEVLLRYWSPLTPRLLAEDVLAARASQATFTRATDYLRVLRGLEAYQPGAFDELFTAMATAPGQEPGWVAALIYRTEHELGHTSEAADRVLTGSREVRDAWLRTLLKDRTHDLSPLRRIVRAALADGGNGPAGWLRFAAVLTGDVRAGQVLASDVTEFTDAGEDAWLIALDAAARSGTPDVVGLMWPRLREVALRTAPQQLITELDRVAAPGGPGLDPQVAADADLLCAIAGAIVHDGRRPVPTMPRLRGLTAPGAARPYASAVIQRIDADPDLKRLAVEALLGDTPDPASWTVLTQLMKQRPSTEEVVCDSLERRLAEDPGLWIDVLPEDLVTAFGRRQRLGWLRPVWKLRKAVLAGEDLGELARVIVEACPDRNFSPPLVVELVPLLYSRGPRAVYELGCELDRRAPGLGLALYRELGRNEWARDLCGQLRQFSYAETERHHQILTRLGGPRRGAPQSPPPSSPPPPAQPQAPPAYHDPDPWQPPPEEKKKLRDRLPWGKP
ncbi:hypothetical protein ACFXPI_03185 [Streptomyces sp. NPDC059104]|uniref:hypothetical protein n=1 Tax=Streptomyces sp. NPDC059104 TaxID=3346729 RepID=UPI003687FA5A